MSENHFIHVYSFNLTVQEIVSSITTSQVIPQREHCYRKLLGLFTPYVLLPNPNDFPALPSKKNVPPFTSHPPTNGLILGFFFFSFLLSACTLFVRWLYASLRRDFFSAICLRVSMEEADLLRERIQAITVSIVLQIHYIFIYSCIFMHGCCAVCMASTNPERFFSCSPGENL